MTAAGDEELDRAIGASLDDLLSVVVLRPVGGDRFAVEASTASPSGRVFGGQLLAQAVMGAAATVAGSSIQSLHAAFVQAGRPGAALEVVVRRLRDGRSMATREVSILEGGDPLLVAIASFGSPRSGPEVAPPAPVVAPPDQMPALQSWARAVPSGAQWIDRPPAVEMRLPEAPSFLTGATATSARSHWLRLPRSVGEDPALNAALLAYASDFFLMDMVLRAHPESLGPGRANGFSLDHVIWFHRPLRFDTWHVYTQEAAGLVGDRGLARGAVHDGHGRLVASVAQEVLLRVEATA